MQRRVALESLFLTSCKPFRLSGEAVQQILSTIVAEVRLIIGVKTKNRENAFPKSDVIFLA